PARPEPKKSPTHGRVARDQTGTSAEHLRGEGWSRTKTQPGICHRASLPDSCGGARFSVLRTEARSREKVRRGLRPRLTFSPRERSGQILVTGARYLSGSELDEKAVVGVGHAAVGVGPGRAVEIDRA